MISIKNTVTLELTNKLEVLFTKNGPQKMGTHLKADKSIVTEIDIFVSGLIKEHLFKHPLYSAYTFFSEEDFNQYHFPCAILDPIDGTRELVKGIPECAVSLALMSSPKIDNPKNYAWLYNPFSGFSLDSQNCFVVTHEKSSQKLFGFVSRTEYSKGRYQKYLNHQMLELAPRGSIAFKLGLLASGACDFIISLEDKNTWDIAAGTVLCAQRGINFYQNGKQVLELGAVKYHGPLVWALPRLAPIIMDIFKDEFKSEIN